MGAGCSQTCCAVKTNTEDEISITSKTVPVAYSPEIVLSRPSEGHCISSSVAQSDPAKQAKRKGLTEITFRGSGEIPGLQISRDRSSQAKESIIHYLEGSPNMTLPNSGILESQNRLPSGGLRSAGNKSMFALGDQHTLQNGTYDGEDSYRLVPEFASAYDPTSLAFITFDGGAPLQTPSKKVLLPDNYEKLDLNNKLKVKLERTLESISLRKTVTFGQDKTFEGEVDESGQPAGVGVLKVGSDYFMGHFKGTYPIYKVEHFSLDKQQYYQGLLSANLKYTGYGTLINYPSQTEYHGEFKNGVPHGLGTEKAGDYEWIGEWSNGNKLEGVKARRSDGMLLPSTPKKP